jgi:hypothetical protein
MVMISLWAVTGPEAGTIESTRVRAAMMAKLRNINGILERCDDLHRQDEIGGDGVHFIRRETLQKGNFGVCGSEKLVNGNLPPIPYFIRQVLYWNHVTDERR